jgi:hypothetical protein
MTGKQLSETPFEHMWLQSRFVRPWVWEQSRLHVLVPTFFANGAEGGEVWERALGSPTHPLVHRGAWRCRAGRGSSAPPFNHRSPITAHRPPPPPPIRFGPLLQQKNTKNANGRKRKRPRPPTTGRCPTSPQPRKMHNARTTTVTSAIPTSAAREAPRAACLLSKSPFQQYH